MAKPMMIQEMDDELISGLKKRVKAKTKIEVVRKALKLLEAEANREARIKQWRKAAQLVSASSYSILREFQPHSRFKKT